MSVSVYVMNDVSEQRMGNCWLMDASQLAICVAKGEASFSRLQLDLSCRRRQWAENCRTLSNISFSGIEIGTLKTVIINLDMHEVDDDAVLEVWRCARKILKPLCMRTDIEFLAICGPFPRRMLQCRSKNMPVINALKRMLTSVDHDLIDLIMRSPLSSVVLTPQLDTHDFEAPARPFYFEELARVHDFLPELHSLGYTVVQDRL